MGARQEHLVLNRDRVELTGAHADERVARRRGRLLDDLEALAVLPAPRLPQAQIGRVQKLLPRLRADGVTEYRLIVAPSQAIGAAILLVGPADRELRAGAHVAIDDRAFTHRRPNHLIALTGNRREQPIEDAALDGDGRAHGWCRMGNAGDGGIVSRLSSCCLGPPAGRRTPGSGGCPGQRRKVARRVGEDAQGP